MSYRISRERFENLAEKAVETLPEEFRDYFTNVAIIVEDYPGKEEKRHFGPEDGLLLGLFSGVPYSGQGGFFDIPPPLPDRITLFQKNIESLCSNEEELIEEIQATLVHEVGHYFGLSEEDLQEYEDGE